jgi:hypothetical protein
MSLGIFGLALNTMASTPSIELRDKLQAEFVTHGAETPEIQAVEHPKQVGQFEKFEVTFTLNAAFKNPFDPDDMDVTGIFTLPGGKQVNQPAFFSIPYEPSNGLTQLSGSGRYRKTGAPQWKLRFASSDPGTHEFFISVRNTRGHTAKSGVQRFTVTPSQQPGFVRISAKNPKYFENSGDGSLFYGCGVNVAWTRSGEKVGGTPSYEYYFGKAKGKMSATRVWMCHWAWLEWMPREGDNLWHGYAGLGYYNQMLAATFDRVFELAESSGLRIMLTLEDNNEQQLDGKQDSWEWNPYNRANGGSCVKPSEFFKTPAVRSAYKKRLRYILARWGYSTSLWALNGWNDYQQPNAEILTFLKEMRDHVHATVGGWRPILYGSNFKWQANDICDYAQSETPLPKPGVVQECYYTDDTTQFRRELRGELWQGFASGLGAIMVWDHVKVDNTGAWTEFTNLLAFARDIPLNQKTWKSCIASVTSTKSVSPTTLTRIIAASFYGDVPDWGVKAPRNEFVINTTENNQWLEGASRTLWGNSASRAPWRNPPTLNINLPAPGKLLIRLTEIGGGTSTLVAKVNGIETKRVTFQNGRRELTPQEQWVEIPLPAGQNKILLDNVQKGGDWLRVGNYYFTYEAPDAGSLINLRGQTSGNEAFLYVQNQTFGHLYEKVLKQNPVPMENVSVTVAGLDAGQYLIVLFDPSRGAKTAQLAAVCSGGKLAFTLPRLEQDLAVKLQRK